MELTGIGYTTLPTPKAQEASDLQRAQTFLDHGAVDPLWGMERL